MWHPPGSDGRGVIGLSLPMFLRYICFLICVLTLYGPITGVLEANFVEPAHDKQGFERTTVLSRLEAKLVQMQKTYWFALSVLCCVFYFSPLLLLTNFAYFRSTYCHKIGYAPRGNRKSVHESGNISRPSLLLTPFLRHSLLECSLPEFF